MEATVVSDDFDNGQVIKITDLIYQHGREKARFMFPIEQRRLVDITAEIMAQESNAISFTYAGFCMTGLPHRRLEDDQVWEKKGHNVTLLVEPGKMIVGNKPVHYGVPYGARARTIMLYLQTQAVKTQSREVSIGRSLRHFMDRLGLSAGGNTVKSLREQAARISACSLKFFWHNEHGAGWSRGGIVTGGLSFSTSLGSSAKNSVQDGLWEDKILLDEHFFNSLTQHAVPISETAIKMLLDRSMSLDLYVWLAYRLRKIERAEPLSWGALYQQFGAGFNQLKNFKRPFVDALRYALAAYPEARVEVGEDGIVLKPSPSPIPQQKDHPLLIAG
jgi:Plasmid encoded RepA protein